MKASSNLNWHAENLITAQTKIKELVASVSLHGIPQAKFWDIVDKIIMRYTKTINISSLKKGAIHSLRMFAKKLYDTTKANFGSLFGSLAIIVLLSQNKARGTQYTQAVKLVEAINYASTEHAVPNQVYAKHYINKEVLPHFKRIAEMKALDPSGHNTLRNLAEMEVRYQGHLDSIENFKKDGVKLVISSTHTNCSERCYKWQGRVYSLDGTSGRTADGREYVPLEVATDIYYTTKAGKTYKNGLLGFNCRHYLTKYIDGMALPTVTEAQRKKAYDLNNKQRALERKVLHYRELASVYKGTGDNTAKIARAKAIEANKEYIEFSKSNHIAYYPDRVKLLF